MSAANEASQKATAWSGTNEVMEHVAAARRVGTWHEDEQLRMDSILTWTNSCEGH